MRILVGLMFVAVVCGMFSRSFDWRGYVMFFAASAAAATVYQLSTGAWG